MTPAGRARMPYIGLRPFDEQDEPLFFGREDPVSSTLHQLEDHPFLAVVGPSGSGKSSIVRAGLLPAIRQGFLLGRVDWAIFVLTPGPQPYERLARLIARDRALPDAASPVSTDSTYARVLTALRTGDQGLAAGLAAAGVTTDTPILIVVDQFEELFAFRRQQALRDEVAMRDEAAGFVRMLLRGCAADADRLRVVITMRSDFIGDAEAFLGLPEAISRSQFLVPRVTRHQMEDIIVRPSTVTTEGYAPFSFEADLANRISNDAGDRSDQLPLMQHALMRTWKLAVERAAGGPVKLTHDDYRTAGGIENALSFHADMAWTKIERDPELARVAKRLFLLLCDVSPDGQITRRRPRVAEVELVTGATIDQIATVLRTFQEDDRNFLLPLVTADLNPETTLDISHESLIRQWKLFDTWLLEERTSAATFQRLQVAARAWPEREPLLRDPALTLASMWVTEQTPTAPWAARYGGDLDRVVQFLTASEQARTDERQAADALRQREMDDAHRREAEQARSARRFRRATVTLTLVSALAVGALIFGYVSRQALGDVSEDLDARSQEVTRLEGELSRQQASLTVEIERQRVEREMFEADRAKARGDLLTFAQRSAGLESQQEAFGRIMAAHGIVARASDGTAIVTFRESSSPPDAALPILAQIGPVSALSLNGTSVTDNALRALPRLTALKTLDLASTDISDAGIGSILTMTSLEDLSLADTLITEKSLLMLPSLPNLRTLDLSRTRVSSPEVALLRTRLPRVTITYVPDVFLEALSASGGDVDVALAAVNGARAGGTLSFHKSEITNAALRALGDYETVTLAFCRNLTNDALRTLARRPKLRRLRLESNSQMTDQGIEHLRTSALTHLDIEDLAITDRSLESLSKLSSLEALRISSGTQEVTDEGVAFLSALRSLKQIALEGGDDTIGPSSVQVLARIPTLEAIALLADVPGDAYAALSGLPRLRVLDVSGSDEVSDDHIGAFTKLTQLEQLNLTDTDISAAGRASLRTANPKLRDLGESTKVAEITPVLSDNIEALLDFAAARRLPTEGRNLSGSRSLSGELRRSPRLGGRPVQAWDFSGCSPGKWVQVELTSGAFDPLLAAVGTTTTFADSNDDSDGLNSRLEFRCRDTAYKLVVSAVGASVGPFRLSTQLSDEPSQGFWRQPSQSMLDEYRALDAGGRSIALGSVASGELREAVQAWTLRGCQNNRVRVELKSEAFDSLLTVVSSTSPFLTHNDDFGKSLDSRLDFVCADGEYKVIVGNLDDAAGAFELSVSLTPDNDASLAETLETVARETVTRLSSAGRDLGPASTMKGELTDTSRLENAPAQAWSLRGCQGQRVVIDLQSNAFDAYLLVAGTRTPFFERNDDGGDGRNSRLEFVCEDTEYTVVVSTLDDVGAFELSVSPPSDTDRRLDTLDTVDRDAVERLPTAGRVLESGSTVNGQLTNTSQLASEPAQAWLLRGCQGQRVVIDLESSAFDAYLIVAGTRLPFLGRNDDGGDGLNSRLEFLCEDTEYRVVVSTLDDLGAFRLRVSRVN